MVQDPDQRSYMHQRLYVWMDDEELVGQLDFNVDGIRQNSVFTYARSWIENEKGYDLSPAMPRSQIVASASLQGNSSPLVLPIADSTPDSWGRAQPSPHMSEAWRGF